MCKVSFGKQPTCQNPLGRYQFAVKATAVIFMAVILFCCSLSGQSFAMSFGVPGEGVSGGLDLTFSYSAMWRVENQDNSAVGITDANADDGNRNFDTGLISNQFKALAEFQIQKAFDGFTLGFFGRGFGLFDSEISDASNDNDSPLTNNNGPLYGGNSKNDEFTDKAEGILGEDVDFLDAFVFTELLQDTGHPLSLKLGWHMVNWGESLFIQSGISSVVSPADASKAALPGTELKEILLPVNQVSGSLALSQNISLSGYYQFEWEKTIPPPSGTYFSDLDFIADGAHSILIGGPTPISMNRNDDIDPDDSGQWGVSLSVFAPGLNETEFGFYYLNYHRKLPDLVFIGDGQGDFLSTTPALGDPVLMGLDRASYAIKHFGNVKLIGASFNTVLPFFDTALSGEVAYHIDCPVQTRNLGTGVGMLLDFSQPGPPAVRTDGTRADLSTREEVFTAQVTFNQVIRMPKLADDILLLTEVGLVHTPGLSDGEFFRGDMPGDEFAWGYKAQLELTYFEAFTPLWQQLSGTDLTVRLNWSHDVDGVSAFPAGSFDDGRKAAGITFDALWNQKFGIAIGYNLFFGAGDDNPIGDRDNVTFALKWRM
jgi:Protein of unknown function (DUF1302)